MAKSNSARSRTRCWSRKKRAADFARAAADIHRDETHQVSFWCPLNEINLYTFIAGEAAEFHPYADGRTAYHWQGPCVPGVGLSSI